MDTKLTFGFGVREHGGRVGKGRLYTSACTDGTRRSADVPTDGNIATHGECPDSVLAIEDYNKFSDVCTDLESPADTACGDARWRRP